MHDPKEEILTSTACPQPHSCNFSSTGGPESLKFQSEPLRISHPSTSAPSTTFFETAQNYGRSTLENGVPMPLTSAFHCANFAAKDTIIPTSYLPSNSGTATEFSWLKSIRPSGPGTNNVRVRTRDKYRMVYSDFQRIELEKEFHTTRYINTARKTELSRQLGLTERQIKIWFQNRRAKERKLNRKVGTEDFEQKRPDEGQCQAHKASLAAVKTECTSKNSETTTSFTPQHTFPVLPSSLPAPPNVSIYPANVPLPDSCSSFPMTTPLAAADFLR